MSSAAEKKKRAAEAQRRQTKAFFDKYTKHLIIAAIALAVIIAAAVIVSNSLYYKGSLAVKDGKVEGYQENWLVKNMGSLSKPKYFKMGEVDLPQGYKSMGALVSDKTEQNFFFAAVFHNMCEQSYGCSAEGMTEKVDFVFGIPFFNQSIPCKILSVSLMTATLTVSFTVVNNSTRKLCIKLTRSVPRTAQRSDRRSISLNTVFIENLNKVNAGTHCKAAAPIGRLSIKRVCRAPTAHAVNEDERIFVSILRELNRVSKRVGCVCSRQSRYCACKECENHQIFAEFLEKSSGIFDSY